VEWLEIDRTLFRNEDNIHKDYEHKWKLPTSNLGACMHALAEKVCILNKD
jgi:hypothetical protein